MGERDWLNELSSALGDTSPAGEAGPDPTVPEGDTGSSGTDSLVAAPPAVGTVPPPVDDELDLMGPGRSLDGWAEQLASAFDDDDEHDHGDGDDADQGSDGVVEPEPDLDDDPVHRALLRFDLLAEPPAPPTAVDESALGAAVDVAVAVAVADVAAGLAAAGEATAQATAERVAAAEARLERVEALLTADLAQLGPAVLADSIGELEARLVQLHAGVTAAAEKVEALPVPDPDALAVSPGGGDPALTDALAESVAELQSMVGRLTDRVAAQARFLAAHADTVSAESHRRDDLLREILARLGE